MTDTSCKGSELIKEIRDSVPEAIDFSDTHAIRKLMFKLFNLQEQSANIIIELKKENQRLKDENNRLKGEKIRPRFKASVLNKENDPPKDSRRKRWKKSIKNDKIKIDKTETIRVDSDILPDDAVFKGYDNVLIQDIILMTNNTLFRLEKFWSQKEGKIYKADLPEEYRDTKFGPEVKSLIHFLKSRRMSECKIHDFLSDIGISISKGGISSILIKNQDCFTQETKEVFEAGMEHSDYFNTDDTGARHNGQNWHTHVFGNPFFSAFFVKESKSRDTIEDLLNLSGTKWRSNIMVSDDAKQFWGVTMTQALCWVHAIRHYRKLTPYLRPHQKVLKEFMDKLWDYYFKLKLYKENSTEKENLIREFDELFSQETGYADLDERIRLTRKNKDRLLVVLEHPQIPLHNNDAECSLREPVIRRNNNQGTQSDEGKIATENMLSLSETCKKLGVSYYMYLKDRISGKNVIPPLAQIIAEKAAKCS